MTTRIAGQSAATCLAHKKKPQNISQGAATMPGLAFTCSWCRERLACTGTPPVCLTTFFSQRSRASPHLPSGTGAAPLITQSRTLPPARARASQRVASSTSKSTSHHREAVFKISVGSGTSKKCGAGFVHPAGTGQRTYTTTVHCQLQNCPLSAQASPSRQSKNTLHSKEATFLPLGFEGKEFFSLEKPFQGVKDKTC